jgi:hypothetical protein
MSTWPPNSASSGTWAKGQAQSHPFFRQVFKEVFPLQSIPLPGERQGDYRAVTILFDRMEEAVAELRARGRTSGCSVAALFFRSLAQSGLVDGVEPPRLPGGRPTGGDRVPADRYQRRRDNSADFPPTLTL